MERIPRLRPRRPAGRGRRRIIAKRFKGKRVAIVHDKTTYGQGLADETRKAMAAKGLKEVLYEGVNKDDKDFTALVSKIKAAGADLVYWGGLHDTGGIIVRQMRDQGVKAPLMGGDGITDDEFASIAGPGAEGTLMTFSPDPRNNPKNKAIVDMFRQKRGFEPQAYTLYSYAAVQIIKQAADEAKSLDPKTRRAGDQFRQDFQHGSGRHLLRQEGRRIERRLCGRWPEEGPLRALRLEEGPGRQDQLFRRADEVS